MEFLQWLCQALWPEKCLVCREEGAVLCVQHQSLPPFQRCSPLNAPGLNGFYAATNYDSQAAQALVKWLKFHRHKAAGSEMVEHICEKVPLDRWPSAVVVPIPLHWWRQQQRGFNQSAQLGLGVAQWWELGFEDKGLVRTRHTAQQALLGKSQRAKNVAGAFAWRGKNKAPETVILLDDVCTTGATLQAAAQTLKNSGTKQVIGVVFAYRA